MSSSLDAPTAQPTGGRALRFVGVCGSLRAHSLNSAVLETAARLCEGPVSMTVFPAIDRLPYFNVDVEMASPPAAVVEWRAAIEAADAVMFACPEYAHGMSGVLKNALEWIVGSGGLVGKPVGVVSASPSMTGGDRAQAWARETLEVMDARVLPESLRIPAAGAKISGGRVTDEATLAGLRHLLAAMAEAAEAGTGVEV